MDTNKQVFRCRQTLLLNKVILTSQTSHGTANNNTGTTELLLPEESISFVIVYSEFDNEVPLFGI